MKSFAFNAGTQQGRTTLSTMLMAMLFVGFLALPDVLFAQEFAGADEKVCGFFDSINGLLNIASIAVVTIAIIFAGYQIAFAHKRISDVAPILIGGLLIGAAGQVAKMLIGDTGNSCSGSVAMLIDALPKLYA
jgi:type IV secretion system protein VirB2